MRHFDVQLIGGIVLHSGKISEMKPVKARPCGHAGGASECAGRQGRARGDVNDYLARRDSEWMGLLY